MRAVAGYPGHGSLLRRILTAAVAAVFALTAAGVALAGPEEELAERCAPAVRLVEQDEECGHGEPYQPSDIGSFLDEDTVSLRRPPWSWLPEVSLG